ncbi:hypothetical protein ACSNOI_46825 [Actinomadura kijaniata]|uniref:hypothetical protein n=1 Tax=Actinomadura kijaniata TaxID=46161 RepID=UPI003F1DABAD
MRPRPKNMISTGIVAVTAAAAAMVPGLLAAPAQAAGDWTPGGIRAAHSRTAYSEHGEGRAWLKIYWNGYKVAIKGTTKSTNDATYTYMDIRYQVKVNGKWVWRTRSKLAKVTPARKTGHLKLHRSTRPVRYVQMRVCAQGLPGSGLKWKCMGWS